MATGNWQLATTSVFALRLRRLKTAKTQTTHQPKTARHPL
jgi:hypothetical protein